MSNLLGRVSRARDKAESARADFETEIRKAAQEHSLRKVAEAARLSHTRIGQIIRGK